MEIHNKSFLIPSIFNSSRYGASLHANCVDFYWVSCLYFLGSIIYWRNFIVNLVDNCFWFIRGIVWSFKAKYPYDIVVRTFWNVFVNNKNDMGGIIDAFWNAKVSIDTFYCNNFQNTDNVFYLDQYSKILVNKCAKNKRPLWIEKWIISSRLKRT